MENSKNPMSLTDSIRMEIKDASAPPVEAPAPASIAAPITASVAAAASNAPSIASSMFKMSSSSSKSSHSSSKGKYDWIFWVIIICFMLIAVFLIIQYFYKKDENKYKQTNNIFTPFFNKIIGFFSGVEPSMFGGSIGSGSGFGTPLSQSGDEQKALSSFSASPIPPQSSGSATSIPNQNVKETVEQDSSSSHPFYQAMNQSGSGSYMDDSGNESSEYNADDSYSPLQSSKKSGKSGWCYIGEDRGFRTCGKVNETDTCMSGDIFPSEEICINPRLRV